MSDPCKEAEKYKEQIDRLNEQKKEYIEKCNAKKYIKPEEQSNLFTTLFSLIKYIFDNKIEKCQDLLDKFPDSNERITGLSKPYIFEALWKIIFLIKLDDLIDNKKYKRDYKVSIEKQEDVEAINYLGIFDSSKSSQAVSQVSKINSGSASGICDLFFTISPDTAERKELKLNKNQSQCLDEVKFIPEPSGAYLFTSKFYKKEKTTKDYDYDKIIVEAIDKFDKNKLVKDKTKYHIVSLVNDGAELKKKILRAGDTATLSYIDSGLIFDKYDLCTKYYPALYKWLDKEFNIGKRDINSRADWSKILVSVVEPIMNISENLRFHQKFIVEYTNHLILNRLKMSNSNPGRYIWGAVARSGKSYMVGGLVAKRKPKVVFLILGAVNETKKQFIDDLFDKYTDLKEYTPIDFQKAEDRSKKMEPGKKYVIVISQENLRAKISHEYCLRNPDYEGNDCDEYYIQKCNSNRKIAHLDCSKHAEKIANIQGNENYNENYNKKNETRKTKIAKDKLKSKKLTKKQHVLSTTTDVSVEEIEEEYSDAVIAAIKDFLKEDDKIVFFDEVHQGSGPDAMQEQTISFFYNYKNIITEDKYVNPLFIMVTATYTKPLGKYGSTNKTLDGEDIVLIEWNYNMMMAMKQFNMGLVTYETPPATSQSSLIEQEPSPQYLIDESDTDFKGKMNLLQTITEEYNQNGKMCEDIALDYYKNPELVYLLPTITAKFDPNRTNYNDINIDKQGNSKVPNIDQIFELEKGKKGFKNETTVTKYLNYIYEVVYDKLLRIKYGYIANGEGKVHSQLWFLPTNLQNSKDNKGSGSIIGPLMELLGKLIIENQLYQNFNVCVINSVDEKKTDNTNTDTNLVSQSDEKRIRGEYEDKIKDIEDRKAEIIKDKEKNKDKVKVKGKGKSKGEDKDNESYEEELKILDEENAKISIKLNDKKELHKECRKVFLTCIKLKKDKSVGECIKDIENESKKNNKSLIILTAQRLRLGISLPCVDVAIHMDTLKSYDIIYQSMFRVLTERSGKKQGFFVDMYLERAVQFFYKYTKIQKHIKLDEETDEKDIDKNRNKMIENMLLFDTGCIKSAIGYTPSSSVVNSYHQIAIDFQVDSNEKYKQLENDVIKNLKNKDDEQMIIQKEQNEQNEPKLIGPRDSEIQQQIQKIIGILKKIPNKDKQELLNKIKEIIPINYSTKKDPKNKSKKDKQSEVEPFMGEASLENNQTGLETTAQVEEAVEEVVEEIEEIEDKDSEDKMLKNTMEQIKNIFTLILLFSDPDNPDITLTEAINTDSLTTEKITDIIKICQGNDSETKEQISNIMYYCYLIQNYKKYIKPGENVIRKNKNSNKENEEDEYADEEQEELKTSAPERGIVLKIVTKYICRDIQYCLKNGQQIRFKHDTSLIATYNKANNNLVYNGEEYESLNKLMIEFYKIVNINSGSNAWSHFEREISPGEWEPMMEIEIKKSDVKVIPSESEYSSFLEKININEYICSIESPAKKPKITAAKKAAKKEDAKIKALKKAQQKEQSKTRKLTIEDEKMSLQLAEQVRNSNPIHKTKPKSKIKTKKQQIQFEIESTIGGATGIPNEEQTTYYILWNIDKEESEKCIEEYNEIQFNKNVNIVDLIDPVEISKIINKYLGEQGLISVLLEKAEPEINKLFDNIKEEMGKLSQRIEEEKEGFHDTNEESKSNICSEFFKSTGNEKVLETIRKYLTPKDNERKLFGEVFTPLELVCEMLSKLPPDVWTNKNLKWLDPANGIGNFPVVVYYKLMKTLKSVPEKERSRWIIEEMLFMNELNKVNVGVCRRIFGMIDSKAKPNFLATNFLTQFMVGETQNKKCWFYKGETPIEKFNIILGNPPYNPPKTETGSSGNSIWQNFVMKSYYLLDNVKVGFKPLLLFIHPPGWRKPTDDEFKIDKFITEKGNHLNFSGQIRQGQVWQQLKQSGEFTFIYTNDQLKKGSSDLFIQHFPAVDFYVYQKGDSHSISCDTKNIFLGNIFSSTGVKLNYNLKYLPNVITKESQDILHKVTSKEGEKITFKAGVDKRSFKNDKPGKYKYFYETKSGGIPVFTTSGDNNENISMDKVIMNLFGGINGYYVEYYGKDKHIGVQHHAMYSEVSSEREGRRIERFFKSDIVKFIFLITQYASGMRTMNEPLVANSITIPPSDVTDYYKFFGIEKYKDYIEDTLEKYELFKQPKKTKTETEVEVDTTETKTKKGTKRAKVKKGGKKHTRKNANSIWKLW